jgi:hypothetical protein
LSSLAPDHKPPPTHLFSLGEILRGSSAQSGGRSGARLSAHNNIVRDFGYELDVAEPESKEIDPNGF